LKDGWIDKWMMDDWTIHDNRWMDGWMSKFIVWRCQFC